MYILDIGDCEIARYEQRELHFFEIESEIGGKTERERERERERGGGRGDWYS